MTTIVEPLAPAAPQTMASGTPHEKQVATKSMTIALGGGVALEWYDWTVYGMMASFLSPLFFPPVTRRPRC
ncbi:hypothetical protein CI1B_27420 [Bradyrhizobium ivorense]|uniref:Proline/betaine transporter n=1 Tax=Bradyrhizobium ivorense TaxID=2511166 RepID=A0A508T636_9BRAD|nr:hypothetical protein [Bradyrhizobium ivorense]VIO69536.1 hypothetical protein CI1B_27420 [Bradyrhizobium ivorense]VIO71282.1 hypothetical protein CI41S_29530 [Bradyrhizobium ivorense]